MKLRGLKGNDGMVLWDLRDEIVEGRSNLLKCLEREDIKS